MAADVLGGQDPEVPELVVDRHDALGWRRGARTGLFLYLVLHINSEQQGSFACRLPVPAVAPCHGARPLKEVPCPTLPQAGLVR